MAVKGILAKILVISVLVGATSLAYGGAFLGWFLPDPLEKPVSLKEGSTRRGTGALGYYFLGRSHYGGGYRGGK
jgi:hypothetical protein